ncbi:alpha/beta hydrolase [Microbacterium sp.]|uniref:alpha/beta fold hydrolase n=1 Tax=Microbacterium sp. TaxID=51671 RepID=UPI0033408DF4
MIDTRELILDGDCPIAVRDYGGTGTPVLFLHGALRNLEDWDAFAERLVEDHRLVAMDFRNHGRSGDGEWTWDAVLDDVDRVIAATGLENPVIVGHSLGGMVAALYAVRGGRTAGVVNMDGYGGGAPEQYVGMDPDTVVQMQRANFEASLASWPDGPVTAEAVAELLSAQVVQGSAYGLPAARELTGFARGLRDVDGGLVRHAMSREHLRELLVGLEDVDWMDLFGRVEAPFLIYRCEGLPGVEGEMRDFMEAYNAGLRRDLEALDARAGHVEVKFLPDNHGFNLIKPVELSADIRDFIASVHARA